MRKIKNYLKTGILLGISLLLYNCQKDELINEPLNEKSNNEYELISKTKDWFEQNKIDIKILNYTEIIDWNNAITSNGFKGLIIEVPLILNDNMGTQFSNDKSLISSHRLLFSKDKSGNDQIHYVQISSNVKNFDNNNKKFNYYSLSSNFNGYISILNADNQITEFNKFKNGKKTSSKKQGLSSREGVTCVYIGWWYDDGRFEPISLLYCTDGGGGSDSYYGGGGSGGSNNDSSNIEVDTFLDQNVWDTQNPYDDWNRLTDCEKDFFRTNPSFLYNAKINRKSAENAAIELFSNCSMHNTVADAFRHSYFAALNTQNMGYLNAKTLGDAHECNTPVSELAEKEMDLHNNAWGYNYAGTHSYFTKDQFYTAFINANNNDEIQILTNCN